MATPVDAKVYTMLEASRVFFTPRRGRDEVFCVHYERQIAATLCWARSREVGLKEVIGVLGSSLSLVRFWYK